MVKISIHMLYSFWLVCLTGLLCWSVSVTRELRKETMRLESCDRSSRERLGMMGRALRDADLRAVESNWTWLDGEPGYAIVEDDRPGFKGSEIYRARLDRDIEKEKNKP